MAITIPQIEVCPCCGHPMADKLDPVLSPIKRAIFDKVRESGTKGIHKESLHEWVYGDDPNGGPDSNVVPVHVTGINHRLRRFGLRIVTKYERYRLHVA